MLSSREIVQIYRFNQVNIVKILCKMELRKKNNIVDKYKYSISEIERQKLNLDLIATC